MKSLPICSEKHLIWIDLEMTGLDPEIDQVLELAMLITDASLNILAESPAWVIYQPLDRLKAMGKWCQKTHVSSGLWDRVLASEKTALQVEAEAIEWLNVWVPPGVSPMCGNTVSQDRRFLYKYMPELERYFHYRSIDVSTLKELAKRWYPKTFSQFEKVYPHQALEDIRNSVAELLYYQSRIFVPKELGSEEVSMSSDSGLSSKLASP